MLKLPFVLFALVQKYKKTDFELSLFCGVSERVIDDWRCGCGERPAPIHLVRLARALGESHKEICEIHLALLHAVLVDNWQGPAAKYINIEILPEPMPVLSAARSNHPLKHSSEVDLAVIRKHIWYDTGLQKKIREIASPLKTKPLPNSKKIN